MSSCNENVAFLDAFADGCDGNIDPLVSLELGALLSSPSTSLPLESRSPCVTSFELDADSVVEEFASSVDNSIIPHQHQQQSIMSYFKSSKTGARFTHEEDVALLRGYTERGALDGVVCRRFKNHKLPQLRERLDELVKELVEDRLSGGGSSSSDPIAVTSHDVVAAMDVTDSPVTPTPLRCRTKTKQVDTDANTNADREPATNSRSRSRPKKNCTRNEDNATTVVVTLPEKVVHHHPAAEAEAATTVSPLSAIEIAAVERGKRSLLNAFLPLTPHLSETGVEKDLKDADVLIPPKKRHQPEQPKAARKPRLSKKKGATTTTTTTTALALPQVQVVTVKASVNYSLSLEYKHTFYDRSSMRSVFGAINRRVAIPHPKNVPTLQVPPDVFCYDETLDV